VIYILIELAAVWAVVECARAKYRFGLLGAVIRLVLVAYVDFYPLDLTPHAGVGATEVVRVAAMYGGSVFSFGMLVEAFIESRRARARDQERPLRSVYAWAPVAVADAICLVALVIVGARAM
jgi:hypothetical protein